ncbi:aliphatic sulfonate ABC transporter, permease protein [Aliarcobacter faecis]|uniref:ABC transporter permease subunit n=1 Tax=Aliarcobacter faecis TaxID=1564138 RepID=UPI00047E5823|nr:ABC transporter permease subunit [Aliarcobacter faecis]QKF74415.1 aliphatic sulfonate ABC transporter, permease protein [Aliarcobacter faecis]
MKLIDKIYKSLVDNFIVWLIPFLILVIWQIVVQNGWLSSRVMPAPLDVISAGFTLTANGELIHHFLISLQRAILGLLIGGSIGFILGFITGLSRLAENLLDSTIQMIRTIPLLALVPLVILWFGIGEFSKIFLLSLAVFFPIYLNTFHGLRSVDKDLIEMGRVYGLTPYGLFKNVILPGAMPYILVGLRMSLGFMWLYLIVAETIASSAGIGYMTMNAREFLQTDIMVLGILLYAVLGKISDVLASILEKRYLKWHKGYQK